MTDHDVASPTPLTAPAANAPTINDTGSMTDPTNHPLPTATEHDAPSAPTGRPAAGGIDPIAEHQLVELVGSRMAVSAGPGVALGPPAICEHLAVNEGAPITPDRASVEQIWSDLVDGRLTRNAAATWALSHLDEGFVGEELLIRALLFLHSVDLVERDGSTRHDPAQDAPFLVQQDEIASGLARWRQELLRFDSAPDEWMREYMRGTVRDFATRHGSERGRQFAAKLVRSGDLTPEDAEDALTDQGRDRAGGYSEAEEPGSSGEVPGSDLR